MLARVRAAAPRVLVTFGVLFILFALVAQGRQGDGTTQSDATAAVELAVAGVVAIGVAGLIAWLDRNRQSSDW
jgi:hypothetical protein